MLDSLTEQYLESDRFETQVMFWMADIWHTRVDDLTL